MIWFLIACTINIDPKSVPPDDSGGTDTDTDVPVADGPVVNGYFGTGIAVSGGNLWVSATTAPQLYSAPLSVLSGGDFGDFTDQGVPTPAPSFWMARA